MAPNALESIVPFWCQCTKFHWTTTSNLSARQLCMFNHVRPYVQLPDNLRALDSCHHQRAGQPRCHGFLAERGNVILVPIMIRPDVELHPVSIVATMEQPDHSIVYESTVLTLAVLVSLPASIQVLSPAPTELPR